MTESADLGDELSLAKFMDGDFQRDHKNSERRKELEYLQEFGKNEG